jgi:hypothetical protein
MPPVIIVQVLWLIAQVVNLYLQIMLDYCLSQEKNLKLLNVLYNLAWDLCVCVCVCVQVLPSLYSQDLEKSVPLVEECNIPPSCQGETELF